MIPEKLKDIAVLHSMDSEALTRLAAVLDEKTYADGQTIFAEGDPGESMYFIVHGRIRIEKRADAVGINHKTLALLEAGDYFGEMALLNEKPRSAAAVSTGETRVLRLSKEAFDRIEQTGNHIAMNVLFGMIRTASERIRWLSTQLIAYDEVGKAIGEALDLHSLLDLVLAQLSSATGADWGFLVLRSEFSGRLDPRAQIHLPLTPSQSEAVGNGEGFLGVILRNPQELIVPDFDTHEVLSSCPRLGFETPSLLVAPILLWDQLLGLIALGGKERNQFDLNTLNLARGIARQAAQAILNFRRREEDEARSRHTRPFARA